MIIVPRPLPHRTVGPPDPSQMGYDYSPFWLNITQPSGMVLWLLSHYYWTVIVIGTNHCDLTIVPSIDLCWKIVIVIENSVTFPHLIGHYYYLPHWGRTDVSITTIDWWTPLDNIIVIGIGYSIIVRRENYTVAQVTGDTMAQACDLLLLLVQTPIVVPVMDWLTVTGDHLPDPRLFPRTDSLVGWRRRRWPTPPLFYCYGRLCSAACHWWLTVASPHNHPPNWTFRH